MKLLVKLADIETRTNAANALASLYDAEAFLIFIKDTTTDTFLPAPGFPQTLPNGYAWQQFLQECSKQSVYIESLPGDKTPISAISHGSCIVVAIVGGTVHNRHTQEIADILPLLGPLLQHERSKDDMQLQLEQAETALTENKRIAQKLEATRRQLQKALMRSNEEKEMIQQTREIKNRVDSLTRQRNDLVRINRVKDEFVSIASHQLRTPATAVKQYIGLLMQNYAGELSDTQARFLRTAYESNERQLGIINDLLKTAQLDARDYVLRKQSCDVEKLCNDVLSDFESMFKLKNQNVTFENSDEQMVAHADPEEIKLVLTNIIENASKYTPEGKTITVQLTKKPKRLAISVRDEGVGISKEHIKKIFDKFTRIDNELSDTVAGSGLGLYLVRRIVKLHKGTIKVTSELSKGTTVVVELPI